MTRAHCSQLQLAHYDVCTFGERNRQATPYLVQAAAWEGSSVICWVCRYSVGEIPANSLNAREKWNGSRNPVVQQMLWMFMSVSVSSTLLRLSLMRLRYPTGDSPMYRLKSLAKWSPDRCTCSAILLTVVSGSQ